ncbi:hypothetical protein EC844_12827 [Acinetobacter calcoaceticus]|uniref:Lipoprotein n=1 Tax=Acinetobacter calcoaceticus TaxID=471 RepID=A0A4R1XEI1_ACICA|nr:hypothetical protein EC844_12827 [Acinetobacter calcoaceticus]
MLKQLLILSGSSVLVVACSNVTISPTTTPSQSERAPTEVQQSPAKPQVMPISVTPMGQALDQAVQALKLGTSHANSGNSLSKATAYLVSYLDLNADGQVDAVVLLQGQEWCGSGGCTLLVFKGMPHEKFELLSKSTVVNTPIYQLSSSRNGWSDLSVYSRGTGQVLMQFNGQAYPLNPSLQTAYQVDAERDQLLQLN